LLWPLQFMNTENKCVLLFLLLPRTLFKWQAMTCYPGWNRFFLPASAESLKVRLNYAVLW
jgi:hypothetical protein